MKLNERYRIEQKVSTGWPEKMVKWKCSEPVAVASSLNWVYERETLRQKQTDGMMRNIEVTTKKARIYDVIRHEGFV